MPTNTKIGTEVALVTRDRTHVIGHHFQGQKVKGQGHRGQGKLWRPPAQLVMDHILGRDDAGINNDGPK